MKLTDIKSFFRALDRYVKFPVKVVLTGGAAAVVFGAGRATEDIDFEVQIDVKPAQQASDWEVLEKALAEVARITRIKPQYSTDIDRWSSIAFPERKSRVWARFGKVTVHLLDPGLWAIGKLARGLSTDKQDVVSVYKIIETDPEQLARLWGNALGVSPLSSAQGLFSRNVGDFFNQYAVEIWGKKAVAAHLKEIFLDTARRARAKR